MSNYPNILAIDSSSGACSVAVLRGGKIVAYREELTTSQQAKFLIIMVEVALADSGLQYGDLSQIAVTIGPGSFTGIRIALDAARGIGFAAGIPVLGFSGLEVMAYGIALPFSSHTSSGVASCTKVYTSSSLPVAEKKLKHYIIQPVLSVLNAGKGEVIYQQFGTNLEAISPPILGKFEDIDTEKMAMIGYNSGNKITFPRADLLAQLAAEYPEKAVAPLPFYVRPADAKLPSEPNRI